MRNALSPNRLFNFASAEGSTDPRVVFWRTKSTWPADARGYVFAGRAIQQVGRKLIPEQWDDDAPATELKWPLPEELMTYTKQEDVIRGIQILQCFDSSYVKRRGHRVFGNPNETDIPTPSEWSEAVKKSKALRDDAWTRYRPFLIIARMLADACIEGFLKTASRAPKGGVFTDLDWSEWNSERSWLRFETCRINPGSSFDLPTKLSDGHWIFFENASIQNWLLDISQKSETPTVRNEPTQDEIRLGRKPGRPNDYDWQEFTVELRRRFLNNELEGSIRAITSSMLEWCLENWGKEPAESLVRAKIGGMLDAFELAYNSD